VADPNATPSRKNRWDETPTPGRAGVQAWDSTPAPGAVAAAAQQPAAAKSRWDDTPAHVSAGGGGAMGMTPGATPVGPIDAQTPMVGGLGPLGASGPMGSATPEQIQQMRWEGEIEERNRPLTDDDLDGMFPPQGYKILKPPDAYVPIRTPARKLMATPTPGPGQTPLYGLPQEQRNLQQDMPATPAGLPFVKPEDYQYFAPLLKEDEEFEDITPEEARLTRTRTRTRRARARARAVPVPRPCRARAAPVPCLRCARAVRMRMHVQWMHAVHHARGQCERSEAARAPRQARQLQLPTTPHTLTTLHPLTRRASVRS
jgi:hypothetical protein